MDVTLYGSGKWHKYESLLLLVKHVRVLGPLVRVDLTEVVDHGEAKAFSDSVVICQTIVATSHDVQGSKVPPETENMFSPDFIIVIFC